jgi:hypothetical protein
MVPAGEDDAQQSSDYDEASNQASLHRDILSIFR